MTARFPLTLYSPSMSKPVGQTAASPHQRHTHTDNTCRQLLFTSPLHGFDTFLHKTWNRCPLLCTQRGQVAAKHVVYGQKKHTAVTPGDSTYIREIKLQQEEKRGKYSSGTAENQEPSERVNNRNR